MLKSVLQIAIFFYFVLLMIVWLSPIAFMAIDLDSKLSDLACAITNSGGKYYVLFITAVVAFIFAYRSRLDKHIVLKFLKQFGILFLMLAFFAILNEFGIKRLARFTRPSHAFVFAHSNTKINAQDFYQLNFKQRQVQLKKMIDSSPYIQTQVAEKVRNHWIEEAGYSFPSGHTFNAFLLATVLSFSIKRSRILHFNKYFFVPFIWATAIGVSRVALGAHTALDVSFGAALGIFMASLLLYFETPRNFILQRKQ